ncbi:MAG: hypothetical protein AAGF58_02950 [Pseudomonadota bacterium]
MRHPFPRVVLIMASLVLALSLGTPPANAETQTAQAAEGVKELLNRLRDLAAPATASPGDLACRSEGHAMADKVFELHTQLMVASLTCGAHYADQQSYTKYRMFTRRHADLLRQSQTVLENDFLGDGARAFDAYRTGLANDESRIIIGSSTPSYCRMRKARYESLILTNPDRFAGYARELAVRDRIRKNC